MYFQSTCAFDLETDGLPVDGVMPNITCAATRLDTPNSISTIMWHSNLNNVMNRVQLGELVDYMYDLYNSGVMITTFNGAGFDFQCLAQALKGDGDRTEKIKLLTLKHVDVLICFAATHGYFAKLSSFMSANGLEDKSGCGADAISAWIDNTETSKRGVLEYCGNDVRCLDQLVRTIIQNKGAFRQTKRGTRTLWKVEKLECVSDALDTYTKVSPDVSWMETPPDITKCIAWLNEELPPNKRRKIS